MEDIADVDPQGKVKVFLSDPCIQRGAQVEMLSKLKDGCQFQVKFEAEIVRFLIGEYQAWPHIDVQWMQGVKMEQSGNGMVIVLPDDQLITRSDPHPVSHSQDSVQVRSESPSVFPGKKHCSCRCSQFVVPVVVAVSLRLCAMLRLQRDSGLKKEQKKNEQGRCFNHGIIR